MKSLKFLGADGQILTAGNSGKVPPGQIKESFVLGDAATGVERKEGRAVYFENLIRMNSGADHLRLNYSGGRPLVEGGKPIKISSPWFK